MKKRSIIAILLFLLLTTITFQQKIIIKKFNIEKIIIENNFLINSKELKKSLAPVYNKNLFSLDNSEIKKILMQESFVESFKIKKKYPNTLRIRIYEKKPIAILLKKQNKFLLSDKIDLIKFQEIGNFNHLPYVIGDEKKFKTFYLNLEKINFPINTVKKFIFYDINRWDLETKDKKVIKLPKNNYIESLKNYLKLIKNDSFKKYEMFDYRINNQLILK
tara:strand:+ start:2959 stop:3615 length:657 start_codon:yes stop_codon:yes gene_type:complete